MVPSNTPVVSVLLPCRNASASILPALDSLAAQTLANFEILVVDDGSTDHTAALLDTYARTEPRLRVIQGSGRGIVDALGIAAVQARAPTIARMDADDVCDPFRFEKQLAYLDAHPDVGLCGTLVEHFGEPAAAGRRRYMKWLNALQTPDEIAREIFVECPIPHPTFMMRREVLDAAGGYRDLGWPEDYDLVLRVARSGWRLGKVPEPLLKWRHTASRHSMTSPRYAPESFRALKRNHLMKTILARARSFYQWGAGEVGKLWLREWGCRAPIGVVDINPRKIGKRIHDLPVIAPEDLPPPGHAVTLVAVGAPGARDEIRAWFAPRGYIECRDFWFVA